MKNFEKGRTCVWQSAKTCIKTPWNFQHSIVMKTFITNFQFTSQKYEEACEIQYNTFLSRN
jgi:hypothetical protein